MYYKCFIKQFLNLFMSHLSSSFVYGSEEVIVLAPATHEHFSHWGAHNATNTITSLPADNLRPKMLEKAKATEAHDIFEALLELFKCGIQSLHP